MPYYHKLWSNEFILSEKLYFYSGICKPFTISTKLPYRFFAKVSPFRKKSIVEKLIHAHSLNKVILKDVSIDHSKFNLYHSTLNCINIYIKNIPISFVFLSFLVFYNRNKVIRRKNRNKFVKLNSTNITFRELNPSETAVSMRYKCTQHSVTHGITMF